MVSEVSELAAADRDRLALRFRTLLERLPVGAFEADLDRSCVRVNREVTELTGLAEEELLGLGPAVVLNAAELARSGTGDVTCELLTQIEDAGRRAATLSGVMLDYSGGGVLEAEAVRPPDVRGRR